MTKSSAIENSGARFERVVPAVASSSLGQVYLSLLLGQGSIK